MRRGFQFTLMVVGESGLGKSTLVNLDADGDNDDDYNGNDNDADYNDNSNDDDYNGNANDDDHNDNVNDDKMSVQVNSMFLSDIYSFYDEVNDDDDDEYNDR